MCAILCTWKAKQHRARLRVSTSGSFRTSLSFQYWVKTTKIKFNLQTEKHHNNRDLHTNVLRTNRDRNPSANWILRFTVAHTATQRSRRGRCLPGQKWVDGCLHVDRVLYIADCVQLTDDAGLLISQRTSVLFIKTQHCAHACRMAIQLPFTAQSPLHAPHNHPEMRRREIGQVNEQVAHCAVRTSELRNMSGQSGECHLAILSELYLPVFEYSTELHRLQHASRNAQTPSVTFSPLTWRR